MRRLRSVLFAPADQPKYAVVMMVSQGGTGAFTSAPSVRKIYEAIYGITGSTVDPAKSVLKGGAPTAKLPTVRADGTPVYPGMPTTTTTTSSTAGTTPAGTTAGTTTAGGTDAATTADAATPSQSSSAGLVALPVLFGVGLVGRRSRRSRDGPRWWSR